MRRTDNLPKNIWADAVDCTIYLYLSRNRIEILIVTILSQKQKHLQEQNQNHNQLLAEIELECRLTKQISTHASLMWICFSAPKDHKRQSTIPLEIIKSNLTN